MKAKILSCCGQKGGIGKSTTSMNLGAALSLIHDKKVLLVDLDPQSNLSEYVNFKDDSKATVSNLLLETSVNSYISADTVKSAIRYNEKAKLHYIPADLNLANTETIMQSALARETLLKRILTDEVTEGFDYVIIDCLPSLGILLINALAASDGMIVPVQPQKFSLDGLKALFSLYTQIKGTINSNLTVTGILPTMVDRTVVSRNSLEILKEKYGEYLFRTSVSKSVEAARSAETGIPLCLSKSRIGAEYRNLADEITGGK